MKADDRYRLIATLIERIQKNPNQYLRAIKAAQLSLMLLEDLLRALETGEDPNLSTSIQWTGALTGFGSQEADMSQSHPEAREVADLMNHTIEVFMEATANKPPPPGSSKFQRLGPL